MKRRVYLSQVWLALSRDALRRALSEARGVRRFDALIDAVRYAKYALEAGDAWVEIEDEPVTSWGLAPEAEA